MRQMLFAFALLFAALTAYAQPDYIGKFDAYTGFTYASSPGLNLDQRGFHTQGGLNRNRWLSMGIDYSIFMGESSLAPSNLTTKEQNQLGAFAASQNIPPSVVASLLLPYDITTQTFAGGPQLAYRHFKRVAFLFHPGLGLIHESVKAKPGSALQTGVVDYLESVGQLSSSNRKSDTTYFWGVGGGVEWTASRNVHLRFTTDYVHTPIFDGFLKNPVNVVRFSVGPTFNFGKNVAQPKNVAQSKDAAQPKSIAQSK
jgi:opacity protein-like surface antigen